MIARLSGILVGLDDDYLIVDVSGVGYEVLATGGVLSSLPPVGQKIELVVYTDVRETAISLFGFRDRLEKQVFLLLKKVKGIGPKIAMSILSAVSAERLLQTIGSGDVGALTKVQGVGKKTAERIVVELREQVGQLPAEGSTLQATLHQAPLRTDTLPVGPRQDAMLALEKLGFSSDRARGAVESAWAAGNATAAIDAGELVRQALARI